jgi:hypothetical protein
VTPAAAAAWGGGLRTPSAPTTIPLMTIPIEIMLRGEGRVFTESLDEAGEAGDWSPEAMRRVLEGVLQAMDRALRPAGPPAPVQFRGMNWIVSPYESGVVLAIEVHSASAVCGPFPMPAAALEALVVSAVGSVPPGTVVH